MSAKNSDHFSHYHPKIMQFDWFLSALDQKWLENHDIYNNRSCWVGPGISTLRTSPSMEVPLVWRSFDWTVTTWACFCLTTLPLFLQSEIKTSEVFDGNDKRLLKKKCFWILATFYDYGTHCSKIKINGKNCASSNSTSQGFLDVYYSLYMIYPLPKFSSSGANCTASAM